uniref:Nucleoside phosphatase GDA1/CD39 n=1 Tax=Parastrongyloides trichosuri TaxID=131310 RepID=A0A0N4ZCC8_PARTI
MGSTEKNTYLFNKGIFSLKFSLVCSVFGIIVALILLPNQQSSNNKKDEFTFKRNSNVPYNDISKAVSNYYEKNKITNFYAAVIDAGSTGTRLHLFHSIHNGTSINPTAFRIESETFLEVKPGLSAFADNPEEASLKVKILIDKAKDTIPKHLWKNTPITLKATAGLRLLKNNKANDILKNVSDMLEKSGFILFDNAVGIMPGINEGVYAWITLNFLTNRVKNVLFSDKTESLPNIEILSSAASMDLGGGSTQLTFKLNNIDSFNDEHGSIDNYTYSTNFFGDKLKLYSRSYLGNGLVASRLGVSLLHHQSQKNDLKTPCFPFDMHLETWNYGDVNWNVKGVSDSSFLKCLELNKIYVQETTKVKKMNELEDKDIFGFSYFYDRGLQAGLVPASKKQLGGYITVYDYKLAAEKACLMKKEDLGSEHWKPWQCHDLTYIYTLLYHGYGLQNNKRIYLAKKLRGMEMSWALGASYDLLTTYFDKHVI